MREEIFGPVLSVTSYDDGDELDAADRAGQRHAVRPGRHGLDERHRDVPAPGQRLKSGAVFVNMPPIPDMAAPWGGYKASGWGREMGPWAIDAYTEVKSVWLHYGG